MPFTEIANELVEHIFKSCTSVQDLHHLTATCKHFRNIWQHCRKLPILYQAAEAQYGPLDEAIQVATYNQSQPVHIRRSPQKSQALLTQLLFIGRVAKKWEDIYPSKKWKDNFEDRRLLTSDESYRLRRAIYRLWLYCNGFHNPNYSRRSRTYQPIVLERAELLHNWSSQELAEIEDVRMVIRDVLKNQVCPSNGTVQRKFRKRFPESTQQLMFNVNIHLNYPPPAPLTSFGANYHTLHQHLPFKLDSNSKYVPTAYHEPGQEGWGDDVANYYIIEDMMKLDPAKVMHLKENARFKSQVEAFINGQGEEWFKNNGETFGQTLEWVLGERGEEVAEFRTAIEDGEMGLIR
jgi:hypothetical protein